MSKLHKRKPEDVDPRFDKTFYLIETDDCSRLTLWREYSKEAPKCGPMLGGENMLNPIHGRLEWEQDNPGKIIHVGDCDDRPVHISCFWNILDGKYVCFWEATSQVVDYKLIEEWFALYCPKARQTNAMNFHNCHLDIKRG
jgi:hypothetical protein